MKPDTQRLLEPEPTTPSTYRPRATEKPVQQIEHDRVVSALMLMVAFLGIAIGLTIGLTAAILVRIP